MKNKFVKLFELKTHQHGSNAHTRVSSVKYKYQSSILKFLNVFFAFLVLVKQIDFRPTQETKLIVNCVYVESYEV